MLCAPRSQEELKASRFTDGIMWKTNITRLDHAKALRALGLPLDTAVVDHEPSARSKKNIDAVFKATRAFGDAVLRWKESQGVIKTSSVSSPAKVARMAAVLQARNFVAVCRKWEKLFVAIARVNAQRRWVDWRDDREAANVEANTIAVILKPCAVVCRQWDEILTALENGEAREFTPAGRAPWPLGPFPTSGGAG